MPPCREATAFTNARSNPAPCVQTLEDRRERLENIGLHVDGNAGPLVLNKDGPPRTFRGEAESRQAPTTTISHS